MLSKKKRLISETVFLLILSRLEYGFLILNQHLFASIMTSRILPTASAIMVTESKFYLLYAKHAFFSSTQLIQFPLLRFHHSIFAQLLLAHALLLRSVSGQYKIVGG